MAKKPREALLKAVERIDDDLKKLKTQLKKK
jgi:DNA-directed RNA polymerase subunit L